MTTHSRAVLTSRMKTSAAVDRTMDAFRKFVRVYALVISLLIAPPIFERFFAMLYLFQGERVILWIASLLLMSISLYGFFGRLRPTWVYLVLFNLLVLISVELGARSAVKLFFPNKEVSLARRAAWTYDELRRMTGHPFLQFNGVPSRTGEIYRVLKPGGRGAEETGNLSHLNNFDIVGCAVAYATPPGVIRIAALGASTTADGYPAMLEAYIR